ncbi:MAG: hypothetical protein ACE5FU_08425 [Nitrospinota bacterium]
MSTCFKCGRFGGVKDEWKKMETLRGNICYVCFNRVRAEQDQKHEEQRLRERKKKKDAD